MKGIAGKALTIFSVAAVFLACLASVSADSVPYASYTYDCDGNVVESGSVYSPMCVINGEGLNVGGFSGPADLFERDGYLYVLDSGNSRIVKTDIRGSFAKKIIPAESGEEIDLTKATGIYVDAKERIFIADSGNNAVWVLNADGAAEKKITKPDSEYFDKDIEFLPSRVIGDSVGNIYVQSTGIYDGLCIFDSEYQFTGFFGSEKVKTTSEILTSYFWKQFMTSEQKESMANYVPSEIYSMDISSEDFIYTITPGASLGTLPYKQNSDSIRCLNPKGSDTLKSDAPRNVEAALDSDNLYLNFIDVSYSESGYINLLDNKHGRIYQYDDNMRLITAFSGMGDFAGTFSNPCAIESTGEYILVLDAGKNNITVFEPTLIGTKIHNALSLYNSGNYQESLEPWLEVIEQNPNFQLAYIGIGNALFNEGNYKEAMSYYELAKDTEGYSNAYKEYRVIMMRNNIVWIVLVIVLAVVAIKLFSYLKRKKGLLAYSSVSKMSSGYLMWYSARHPFIGFDAIRYNKRRCYPFCVVVFLLLVALGVAEQLFMGKSFGIVNTADTNILTVFLIRLAIVVLFVLSNWALSVLLDGKATVGEICTFSSIALVPYIICGFIRVILSHFLTAQENIFLTLLMLVGIGMGVALMLIGFSVFHEFETGKAVLILLLTLVGMLLITVLAFLLYSLTQNIVDFVRTIAGEFIFRMNR